MMQKPENVQGWLRSHPLFAALKDSDIVALLRVSQIQEMAKGDTLFLQGDSAGNFYVVISGWIKLFRETNDGHEAIVGLHTEDDTFGEAVLYQGSTYPFGAQAIESSRVLLIPAAAIKDLIQRHSEFAAAMVQALSQRMQMLEMQSEHLAIMAAPQRIGCFLLKLCRGKPAKNAELALPYDKGIIAASLGIKLETFSRSLHQLKPAGVEVNGPKVTIADVNKLQEYVCVTCSREPEDCEKESGKK